MVIKVCVISIATLCSSIHTCAIVKWQQFNCVCLFTIVMNVIKICVFDYLGIVFEICGFSINPMYMLITYLINLLKVLLILLFTFLILQFVSGLKLES